MRARDLLARTSITDVWAALGGDDLRHGRGKAFWRDGDGDNIAVNESKNVFFDHAWGEGGGILVLIETVLSCKRREALRWLAAHEGVSLDNQRPLRRRARRQYATDRSRAESQARDLTAWRRRLLRRMGEERNRLYISENAVSAVGRTLLAETGAYGNENAWACIWKRALDDQRGDEANRQIEAFEKATVRELIAMRQQWEGLAA